MLCLSHLKKKKKKCKCISCPFKMSEAEWCYYKKSLQEKLELGRHLSDEWPMGGDADTGSTGAQSSGGIFLEILLK